MSTTDSTGSNIPSLDILTTGKSVEEREDEGITIDVKDVTGETMWQDAEQTKPVTITVVGTYSKRYRRANDATQDRMLKQRRQSADWEQIQQQSLGLVAACVLAWDGFVSEGEPFPLTRANATALLKACPWIREQVEAAMNDHASFFAKS